MKLPVLASASAFASGVAIAFWRWSRTVHARGDLFWEKRLQRFC